MEGKEKTKLHIIMIMNHLHYYSMKVAAIKLVIKVKRIRLTDLKLLQMNIRKIENSAFAAV